MCPSGKTLRTQVVDDLRSAFDILDADHDGKISREDLHTFYSSTKTTAAITITGDDYGLIETMISVADSNKDGYVQYEEFEQVMDEIKRRSSSRGSTSGRNNDISGSVMEDVFRVMDRDGDGKLSYEDLKGYMQWAGFHASDEDIKAMMRLGGGDEDEGVSYEGLLKILAMDDVI